MMSPTQRDCHSFQLIDGRGEFNEKGLHNFITATNLSKCGKGYAVIAIIGPQSSGKSTFMNHFGGTNFKEMNSKSGRNQTTQGIWISKCVTIHRPLTIAMDIEGTDGEERGEDDTAFEGQSALFALAVADILIVNLWCHDIGRQKAASTTLLQTVLQIRMRMDRSRKVKLCFILRDYTHEETPIEILEEKIKITMEKIWTEIARTNGFERTNMSDFFHVLVFGLPHYKFEKKEFEDQVAELREKIISVDREGVVPAKAFQANAHQLWKTIKEERFLNLPAHSEMIAEHMCKEIANTWLESLTSSEDLMELKMKVEAGRVKNFGDKLHCHMETTLSKYLSEVQHFKEHIVKEREKVLKSEILEILHPLYVTMLGHVRNETLQEFKMMFTRMLMKGVTFVVAYEESYDICKRMLEHKCKDVVGKLSAGWDWLGCNKELCNEIENYALSKHMCKEIANTWLKRLTSSKDLMELKKEVEAGHVNEFGDKLHCLMETTLSKYLSEVQHFKEHKVKEREKVLRSEILEILHPLYVTMLGHVRNETFQEFKKKLTELQMTGVTFDVAYQQSYDICKKRFEEQCKDVVEKLSAGWDWLGCNKELFNEIENYALSENKCKEIANARLKRLTSSKNLMELKKEVEAGLDVCEFGDKLHGLMEIVLSKYLNEVQHFKKHIVKERKKVLKSKILEILHPLYVTMLGHVRNETLQEFKMRFTRMLKKRETFDFAYEESYDICKRMLEQKCKDVVRKLSAGWDWSGCNKELCNEIEKYASSIRSESISKLKKEYQDEVADYITKSLEYQLQNCTEDTYWASIREVVRKSTSDALISNFSSAVATYSEDISLSNKMIQELKTYARNVVLDKLRAEVDKDVVNRMIIRFWTVLLWDENSTKRDWANQKKKAEAIIHQASVAALNLLSVMAVVQLDEKSNNCIEGVLLSSLLDAKSSKTYHLDTNKWKGVSEDDTIIVPWKCKSLWSQFEDAKTDILMEFISDMKEIKMVKGKEERMRVMSVVSTGVGVVVTLLAGLLGVLFGNFNFTASAVMKLFDKLVQYFEEKKREFKQYAIDLQERWHLRHLRHLKHCHTRRQLSLQ